MRRGFLIVSSVFACALACAACGSSKHPNGKSGGDSLAIQFANCMRAHGVSNFPDPGQDRPAGLPQSPAFNSAQTTCDRLQPGGTPKPPKPSQSRQLAMAKFARCMRAHGVSSFPDPTLTPPNGAGVIDVAGIFFVLPAGLNLQSPAVKRASAACGSSAGPL